MPTALVRFLKTFKPELLWSLRSHKAAFDRISGSVCCRRLTVQELEKQFTASRGSELSFFSYSLPPPSEAKKEPAVGYHSNRCWCHCDLLLRFLPNDISMSDKDGFVSTGYPIVLRMEAGKGTVPFETNQKAKEEEVKDDEEKLRLKTEKDKEEERMRAIRKEEEMEEKIGPPPEKPLPGDCCGQGCEVCVWDTYWEELDSYKKLRKAAEDSES